MKALIDRVLDSVWSEISTEGKKFKTPDDRKGAPYRISKATKSSITIETEGASSIRTPRAAFTAAIQYLVENGHLNKKTACLIEASQSVPGPLNRATRMHTKNTMSISYIMPILAFVGVVSIDGSRKNKTWINL